MKRHPTHTQVKRFAFLLLAGLAFTLPARAQYTSTYPQVNVAGDFNGFETLNPNMTLVGNNLWQADLTINTNAFRFKFSTPGFASNWGLNSQPHTTLPQAMTALSDQGDIIATNPPIAVVDGGVTNLVYNPIRFIFNDATREFAVFVLNNTAASNLLYNASFETAGSQATRARYWEQNNPNIHGAMLGTAERQNWANPAKSGSWVGLIKGRWANQGNSGSWWQETPVEPGVTYEASAWFQPEDTPNLWTAAVHQLKLEYWDFNRTAKLAEFIEDISEIPNSNTNWVRQFVGGTAPAGAAWGRLTVFVDGVGPSGTFRIDDAELRALTPKRTEDFNDWGAINLDGTYARGGWTISSGRTVSGTPLARSGIAASIANPASSNVGGFVMSPRFDDGIGTIRFWYRHGPAYDPLVDTNEPVRMVVQVSTIGDFWTTVGSTNIVFNQTYQEFVGSAPADRLYRYVRILHAGGSANRLLIDDIAATAAEGEPRLMDFDNWPASITNGLQQYGGWTISNGIVSASLALSGRSGQVAGNTNNQHALYSPVFTNGHGAISFNYRAGLDSAKTLGWILESRAHPGTSWVERARVTNINTTAWQEYSAFFLEPGAQQLRIRNLSETNTSPLITTDIREGFGSTPPAGWTFASSYQLYTGSTESGTNTGPPALKFDGSTTNAVTPGLVNPTNISFMIRGSSITETNLFRVEQLQGSTWSVLASFSLTSADNTRKYYNYAVSTNVTQLRFSFDKTGGGNLSFDDFIVRGKGFSSPTVPQRLILDNVDIGIPVEYRLQDFNTWPDKPELDAGTTFHQGWTIVGPAKIGAGQSISGNAITMARIPTDGGTSSPAPAYTADFEDATKTSYGAGTVSLRGLSWNMTEALIGQEAADYKNGIKSARMRGYGTSEISMLQDWTNGLTRLAFNYARYGTDGQVPWQVQLSTNSGSSWVDAGATFTAGTEPAAFTFYTNLQGKVRIKIKQATGTGTSNRRMNIDDITLTGYVAGGGGGSSTNAVNTILNSHKLVDGIGGVRFSYRHASSTPPATNAILTAAIQTSANGINWTNRNSLVISNTSFVLYEVFLNLTNDLYARLAITNGLGEAILDNVEIFRPQPPVTVSIIGYNEPEIPFTDNEVTLKATVTPQYGAINIAVTSYYRIGTSGVFKAIPMTSAGGNDFVATTNIPPQPSGTLVQYYMSAIYDGPGANLTRPVTYPAGAPTNAVASYGIPRNAPGKVWINEVDYYAQVFGGTNCPDPDPWLECPDQIHQFIELAGFSNIDITGWKLEIYDGGSNPPTQLGTYLINSFVIPDDISGFGFFLLAGDGISAPPRDMALTNDMQYLFRGVGIRLLNEFGGEEDAVSIGGFIPGYDYVSTIDNDGPADSLTNSISLIGTSAGRDNFDWGSETTYPTPGATNVDQVFAEPASIGVSTNKLTFNYYQGSLNSPVPQTLVVSNAGVSALTYSIAATPTWITVEPFSALTLSAGQSQIHTVRVNTASLTGTRTGYLTIDGQADNSPLIVNIEAKPVELQPAIIHYAFKTERIDTSTKTVLNDGSLGSLADLDLVNGAEFSLAGRGITGTRNDIAYESTSNTARGVAGVITNLNNMPRFTLTGWINPQSTGSSARILMSNQSGTNGFTIQAAPATNGVYRHLQFYSAGGSLITSSNAIATNGWTFYAVTFDGTGGTNDAIKVYTGGVSNNAVLATTHHRAAAATSTGASTNSLFMGGSGMNTVPALLDDFRIYAELLDLSNLDEVRRDGATSFTGAGSAPGFLTQPEGGIYTIAQIGNNHTFSITATGDPVPDIIWRKDGVEISSATLPSYTIVVNYNTAGFYDVILDNGFGRVTSNVAEIQFQIDFIAQPATNIFIYPGDTARFFAQVTPGSNTYQWYSNSVSIAGATSTNLVLSNFTNTNKPGFYLVASNKTGVITSQIVRVNVIDLLFEAEGGAKGITPPTTSSNVVLSWPSMSNYTYDVYWTTNLMAGTNSFVRIATNLPATPAANVWTDRVHGAKGVGFYRIRSTQQ